MKTLLILEILLVRKIHKYSYFYPPVMIILLYLVSRSTCKCYQWLPLEAQSSLLSTTCLWFRIYNCKFVHWVIHLQHKSFTCNNHRNIIITFLWNCNFGTNCTQWTIAYNKPTIIKWITSLNFTFPSHSIWMFPIVFIIIIWLDIYKSEQVLGMTPYKCNLQQHFFISGCPFPFHISEGNTVYVVKYFYHF